MLNSDGMVRALWKTRAELRKLVDEKHPDLSWGEKDKWITGMLRMELGEPTVVIFGDDGYPVVKDNIVQTIW